MGYHNKIIPKGVYGEFSKINEEFAEADDAFFMDNPVMLLTELSDLVGAIEAFTLSKFNITLADLVTMRDATKRAFEDGTRTPRQEMQMGSNGRVYPPEIMQAELAKLDELVKNNSLLDGADMLQSSPGVQLREKGVASLHMEVALELPMSGNWRHEPETLAVAELRESLRSLAVFYRKDVETLTHIDNIRKDVLFYENCKHDLLNVLFPIGLQVEFNLGYLLASNREECDRDMVYLYITTVLSKENLLVVQRALTAVEWLGYGYPVEYDRDGSWGDKRVYKIKRPKSK